MIDEPNSLEIEIAKVRALIDVLSKTGPTPLLRDFYRLLQQLCVSQESYLLRRSQLLEKSVVKNIANGIARSMLRVMADHNIPELERQAILHEVMGNVAALVEEAHNQQPRALLSKQ